MEGVEPTLIVLDWRGVAVVITVVFFWSTLLVGVIRWLINRVAKHMDDQLVALTRSMSELADGREDLRRELAELKQDLPVKYVRKEDQIRDQTVIHAKLDKLADVIMKLKGGRHA